MHLGPDSFHQMKWIMVTFEVGVVSHCTTVFISTKLLWIPITIPLLQIHVGFALESIQMCSHKKRTIRGQNVYAGNLATGKW